MIYTLAIDSSTQELSVALSHKESGIVSELSSTAAHSHNEKIGPLVVQAMEQAGGRFEELGLILVGNGPGSFTGLRIGLSFAKGLGAALKVPVVLESSFLAAALEFRSSSRIVAVASNAKRGEVFRAIYQTEDSGPIKEISAPSLGSAEEFYSELKGYSVREKGNVVVVAASPDIESEELTFVSPTRLAAHLIMAHENAPRNLPQFPDFSVEALSRLEPTYLRAVAAKTIEERKGPSASH